MKNPTQFRRPDGIGKFPGRQESMAVLIFGFLDEGEESSESLCNSGESSDYGGIKDIDVDDDELVDERNVNNVEKDKAFWESKEQNLKVNLIFEEGYFRNDQLHFIFIHSLIDFFFYNPGVSDPAYTNFLI